MKKTSRGKDILLNALITLGPVIIMGLIIVGLSALLALVMLPNYSPGESIFLICLVVAVIAILAFLMVFSLVMFAKNRYIWDAEDICLFVISIIIALASLALGVVMFFVYDNLYGTGFESGDFSAGQVCSICSKPADGGMFRGGKEEDKYYCKDHYKRVSSSQDKSFTNKYGSPNTKCAVDGCTNKIVSSGDSNSCATHSQKCLSCRCYIDYDAMYCMQCIEDALRR